MTKIFYEKASNCYQVINDDHTFGGVIVTEGHLRVKDTKLTRDQIGKVAACERYANGEANPTFRYVGMTLEQLQEAIESEKASA